MTTFDDWWENQPIATSPDTERVRYLRDMAHRVWTSAQAAERAEWSDRTQGVTARVSSTQRASILQQHPALLSWGDLLTRAETVFIDDTTAELGQYTFSYLVRAIKLEEDDRKHGAKPNYRIEDVWMDDDCKS